MKLGVQNLCIFSAEIAFIQGGIFIVPLTCYASIYTISSEGSLSLHVVNSYMVKFKYE